MRACISSLIALSFVAGSTVAFANRALPSTNYKTPRAGALKVAAYVMDRNAAYRNEFDPRGAKDLKVGALIASTANTRRYNIITKTSSPNGPDVEVKITMKKAAGQWKASGAGAVKINYAE
jgi:hypothetical protein